ncbi:phosphoribosylformylglycinamidine synthase subunit PurS [Alkalicoccus saliphilus]|jgi:phosphoribosylformylglycinamidine synthase subunit PurS|uniref:Phosphoribosylformylglycinamidine synthase subunit PurS n=1 Tax=Alkalicoccus saliphilus TaxID=200989 RepID=A0A2T4U720_9BACI|nr:phosphoribosylformylglycinamidine synthase subunit PurS [Alkalicoccus saliphilus]PTL39196.1 phosphoribosylformylglycinamidine synthase [Alkalicoccus saliphilus]
MTYNVKVYISWKEGVLDPQGAAVTDSLHKIGYSGVESVSISRMVEVKMEADRDSVERQVTEMCEKLLANPVIEDYSYEIEEVVSS